MFSATENSFILGKEAEHTADCNGVSVSFHLETGGVLLVDVEIHGDLVVVAGVGVPVGDAGFGDHAHLEEGAEDIPVVVQNGLLQLDGKLSALGGVELGGEPVEQIVDMLILQRCECFIIFWVEIC